MENENEDVNKLIEDLPNVSNLTGNSGREIPNQFRIDCKGYTILQSYKSPIVLLKNGKTYLFKDWDYSVTTGKYRNDFLGETKKETLAKLKSGEYIAVDFEVKL